MHSKVILVAAIIVSGTGAAQAQDAAAGAAVFKTQCSICHSVIEGKNMVGPSLFGVVGRQAGQVLGIPLLASEQRLRTNVGRGDAGSVSE